MEWYFILGIVLVVNFLGVATSLIVFLFLTPKIKKFLQKKDARFLSQIENTLTKYSSDQIANLEKVTNELVSVSDSLDLNKKSTDRLLNDVDFIKNHSSSYLGQGIALTHLVDETPIYINSNDYGGPANFINGGRYEEEYYQVLASFCFPDAVFLDIGANLGVFALRLAPLLRRGSIHAFEPNDHIRGLLKQSLHLNGLGHSVNLHGYGLSDTSAKLAFSVPEGHAGGGSIELAKAASTVTQTIQVHRLDDQFPQMEFDFAKIDVEGHELSALKGMREAIRRSVDCVLMFEKLNAFSGIESELWDFFEQLGLCIYRIDDTRLNLIDLQQFKEAEAYFIAARPAKIQGKEHRNSLNVYPSNLFAVEDKLAKGHLQVSTNQPHGSLLFHGPYWYLPRGSYRVDIVGEVLGSFDLVMTEKYGFKVNQATVSAGQQSIYWVVERDLQHFELVGRSTGTPCSLNIERLTLTRLG